MRRIRLVLALGVVMAAILALSAAPAIADERKGGGDHKKSDNHKKSDDDNVVFRFVDFDDFDFDDFADREVEQEAESGDANQSFIVTNTGDNSNQCVGVQGVANTGNAQNVTGVSQFDNGFGFDNFHDFDGDGFGDFEIEDSGASIEVSPSNTTTCDQQVNQAASATGPTYYWW